jgi:hypothetical protein
LQAILQPQVQTHPLFCHDLSRDSTTHLIFQCFSLDKIVFHSPVFTPHVAKTQTAQAGKFAGALTLTTDYNLFLKSFSISPDKLTKAPLSSGIKNSNIN